MNCDRCGQEIKECGHNVIWINNVPGGTHEGHLLCADCGHNFGPVRKLIENAGLWNMFGSSAGAAELIATLTRERDEARAERSVAMKHTSDWRIAADSARARIAELEKVLLNGSELIEANEKLMNEEAKLRSEVERLYAANGLLLKGRDADRARIAELESAKWNVEAIVFHKNGTWEWRKG
jgi:hypothetical protein